MRGFLTFFKKRIVFCLSFILAVVSCFFTAPSKDYLGYIDWNTLAILFALMAAIQGLNSWGIFKKLGDFLCSKCNSSKMLCIILVFICFICSMFITNDVALLTFVPFALILLTNIKELPRWVPMYTVILQTIAANTGSMLTPIGNPQNLFIYEKTGMALGKFLMILLPYTLICGVLLLIACLIIPGVKFEKQSTNDNCPYENTTESEGAGNSASKLNTVSEGLTDKSHSILLLVIYICLFVLCLLSVIRLIPKPVTALVCLAVLLIFDRKTLGKVDYFLLLTFVCFFIFSGNLSNIASVKSFLQNTLVGRECLTSALVSQVVSNVPATLMLYSFTQNTTELLLGVNFGGLGTLIGSLASLISFNIYTQFDAPKDYKLPSMLKFLGVFTLLNVLFLLILFGVKAIF